MKNEGIFEIYVNNGISYILYFLVQKTARYGTDVVIRTLRLSVVIRWDRVAMSQRL
jgi:hypothetical protein